METGLIEILFADNKALQTKYGSVLSSDNV